jgi:hypothetical protein
MRVKIITSIYSDLYGSELGGRPGRKDHYRFSLLSLLFINNFFILIIKSKVLINNKKRNINKINKFLNK